MPPSECTAAVAVADFLHRQHPQVHRSERKPLLPGRGVVGLEEFCLLAGLEEKAVASLIESGRLSGLVDDARRAQGIFEDQLPSVEHLRAIGLTPRPQYDPAGFPKSHEEDDEDEPDDDSGRPSRICW